MVHVDACIRNRIHVFGHVDVAEPGQNGRQQFILVLHHDEEARVVAELLDAAAQRGLRVGGQMVCV